MNTPKIVYIFKHEQDWYEKECATLKDAINAALGHFEEMENNTGWPEAIYVDEMLMWEQSGLIETGASLVRFAREHGIET